MDFEHQSFTINGFQIHQPADMLSIFTVYNILILRWVSTHSDGGHLVLPSLGKINAISVPWRAFIARIGYPLGCQNAIYWKEVYVRDHIMPPGGNFSHLKNSECL